MAQQGIQLEIVTPKGVVLSKQVEEVIAPSVAGEFGVLPGHLPLLAALATGLVHYRLDDELIDVGVGVGFVEVLHDRTLLLTDRFITKDEVDVLAVRERLAEVDEELHDWQGELNDPMRLELIEEEQWLAAQLELIGDPPVAKILSPARAGQFDDLVPQLEQASADDGGEAED